MASIAAGLFFRIIGPLKHKNQCIYELTASVYKYQTNREQWQSLFYWSETGAANANTQVSLIAQASPLTLHLEFKR